MVIGTAHVVPFFCARLRVTNRYVGPSPRPLWSRGGRKIVEFAGPVHHSRGGWFMPTTQSRTPLNETRIWDYISFLILVLLSVLAYSWLVPH